LLMPGRARLRRAMLRDAGAWAWLDGTAHRQLSRRSLGLVIDGILQVAGRRQVVTDRLHGALMASLLGVPNVLVSNVYFKNEAFIRAWGDGLSRTTFARDTRSASSGEDSDDA
jgi:exopolysaccharide biosynthesis predicted pyruvyltransferase EpsI